MTYECLDTGPRPAPNIATLCEDFWRRHSPNSHTAQTAGGMVEAQVRKTSGLHHHISQTQLQRRNSTTQNCLFGNTELYMQRTRHKFCRRVPAETHKDTTTANLAFTSTPGQLLQQKVILRPCVRSLSMRASRCCIMKHKTFSLRMKTCSTSIRLKSSMSRL